MKKTFSLIFLLLITIALIAGCKSNDNTIPQTSQEVLGTVDSIPKEDIIKRFNEAYGFWVEWVYGQAYRANDNLDVFADGVVRESVTIESPIQSVNALRKEMEKHFTISMADKFFAQLKPMDWEGKLYICTGDVGGPYSGPKNIVVEKINDERYRLDLDIWSYMNEENPDLTDQFVYYVFADGKWVFENDVESAFFYSWADEK